jgi:hypothetical protein
MGGVASGRLIPKYSPTGLIDAITKYLSLRLVIKLKPLDDPQRVD